MQAHGPLPALLVGLTVVTGLVDAYSYLTLGHVFVANMTGNVVFFGVAIAGTGCVSITASLLAVLAFAVGALLGGLLRRFVAIAAPLWLAGVLLSGGAAAYLAVRRPEAESWR